MVLKIKENLIPIIFSIILVVSMVFSKGLQVSDFILNTLSYMMIGLALILPIKAGMGFNFGIGIGAIAGKLGLIVVLNSGLTGIFGMFVGILIALPIAIILGYLLGLVLSNSKGHDMITSLFASYLGDYVFQFIGLFLMGSIIPVAEDLLMHDSGLRNTFDLSMLSSKLMPLVILVLIGITIFMIKYLMDNTSKYLHINGNQTKRNTRINVTIISTVLAAIGYIFYIQNFGYLVTYSSSSIGLIAATALVFGGASFKKTNVSQVILGVILLQGFIYITMPLISKIQGNLAGLIQSLTLSGVLLFGIVHACKNEKNGAI